VQEMEELRKTATKFAQKLHQLTEMSNLKDENISLQEDSY
jgi:hypothetical protein